MQLTRVVIGSGDEGPDGSGDGSNPGIEEFAKVIKGSQHSYIHPCATHGNGFYSVNSLVFHKNYNISQNV